VEYTISDGDCLLFLKFFGGLPPEAEWHRAIRYYSAHAGQFAIPYQRGAGYPLLSLADGIYEFIIPE
jgi:hypothetical protein